MRYLHHKVNSIDYFRLGLSRRSNFWIALSKQLGQSRKLQSQSSLQLVTFFFLHSTTTMKFCKFNLVYLLSSFGRWKPLLVESSNNGRKLSERCSVKLILKTDEIVAVFIIEIAKTSFFDPLHDNLDRMRY